MAVLPEDLDLSFLTSLVRDANSTVVGLGEGLSPGISGAGSLIGNVIGELGIVEDVLDNVDDGTLGGAVVDSYKDVVGPGSIVYNLFDGKGIGTEALMGNVAHTVGDLPLVSEGLQALSPVADVVGQLNSAIVDLTEGLSPGTAWAGGVTGNIIGKSGIVEDVVDNVKEGDFAGLVLDVYKDVLGVGGILNNLGDGEGTGLQSLVHQIGDMDILPLDAAAPVIEPVLSVAEAVNDTLVGLAEGLAPGSTTPGTVIGNIIGELGVVEDVISNLHDGSLTGAISDVYDDIFQPGGIINNFADGGGIGIEGLVGNAGGLLDGLGGGLLDGLPILGGGDGGGLLGGLLDGLPIVGGGEGDGGLLGGVLDGLPILGGGDGGGLLGGLLDGLPIVGGGEGDGGLLGGVLDGLPILGGGDGGGLLDGLPIVGDTLASGDGAASLLSDTLDQVGALLGGGDDAGLPLLGGCLESLPVVDGLLAGLDLGLSFEGHAEV